jgi:methionyl-tRNA formyltransferase
MRIVVIGQAAFGEAVFKAILGAGEEVSGVCAPATPEGARPDPLRASAEGAGLPVLATRQLREPTVFDQYAALRPDLVVMAFVTDILRENVLELPPLGAIQYHPSLLPLHRGSSAINWPIIFGETRTGLTVFWPDKGIDTGPILLQRDVDILPDDTLGTLYFERLFPMGVEAMVEAVRLVREGKAPREPQQHELSTYEPPCSEEHAQIHWHWPAQQVYNLVRGCNPQPGAWTRFRGEKLRIFDCRLTGAQADGMPGTVLDISDAGADIRLNGGVLRVTRLQSERGKKVPAADWASSESVEAGARLG